MEKINEGLQTVIHTVETIIHKNIKEEEIIFENIAVFSTVKKPAKVVKDDIEMIDVMSSFLHQKPQKDEEPEEETEEPIVVKRSFWDWLLNRQTRVTFS